VSILPDRMRGATYPTEACSNNFTRLWRVWLTGVRTPISAPLRTRKPFRESISVGFPRAISCAVEDRAYGIASLPSFNAAAVIESADKGTPAALPTATASMTTRLMTSIAPASLAMRPYLIRASADIAL
jgi:hypothetical protein